jgi:Ca2+-binding EF-hand superfamily protein
MANLLSNADKNNNGQIELRELRRLITASYSTKKIKNALNANLDGL